MDTATVPTTLTLAVLGELHPATRRPDRIHAVVAWTDRGDRHFRRLATPATAAHPHVRRLLDRPSRRPEQLRLPLAKAGGPACTSSGVTWRTWTLPSIPLDLRHLPADRAVDALARQLGDAR